MPYDLTIPPFQAVRPQRAPTLAPRAPAPVPAPASPVTTSDSFTAAPAKPKPKVMLLSLSAGGGHDAAAGAISSALGAAYCINTVKPFDGGVEGYNLMQAIAPPQLLNFLGWAQQLVDPVQTHLQFHGIHDQIKNADPDIVISVIPMANGATFNATQVLKIPMVVVPTDLAFSHFLQQVPADSGTQFKVALPFPTMRNQAPHLPEHVFAETGYPVRGAFSVDPRPAPLGAANATAPVFAELGIEPGDKVALIMMGAGGASGDVIRSDADSLSKQLAGELARRAKSNARLDAKQRVHVVCLCGGNQDLKKNLTPLATATVGEQVQIHAVGRKEGADVAALMQRADAMITKPGGATVNEAIAANLPMIYHSDVGAVDWELENAKYAESVGLGEWVDKKDIVKTVATWVEKGRPSELVPCLARTFPENIRSVVDDLIAARRNTAAVA